MATNNNGNLLDDKGNVVVDFVWGNFPLQPNDQRPDTATGRLNYDLDNHVIAEVGWNGYPLYVPNTDGSAVDANSDGKISDNEIFLNIALKSGVTGTVPLFVGQATAVAVDTLKDEGFATVTTATAATNTAVQPTRINVTSNSVATVTVSGGTTSFPVGTLVTLSAGTGVPTALVGDWLVTGGNGTSIIIAGSGWTVADSNAITPGNVLKGKTGTIKSYALGAGTLTNQTNASTITITPWA